MEITRDHGDLIVLASLLDWSSNIGVFFGRTGFNSELIRQWRVSRRRKHGNAYHLMSRGLSQRMSF